MQVTTWLNNIDFNKELIKWIKTAELNLDDYFVDGKVLAEKALADLIEKDALPEYVYQAFDAYKTYGEMLKRKEQSA